MKIRAFLIILAAVGAASCQAAQSGHEFGKITPEELEMTSIVEDPEADAVILFDFGAVTPDAFAQHRRIKVFTKKGTEFANISIPFRPGEKIKDLEGYTITKDGRRFWLDKKQVFTKEYKYLNEMVFTLPGVEEGCVFEYRYARHTNYAYVLGPWYFQNEIFTKLSQVTLKLEPPWVYSYVFKNADKAKTNPEMVEVYWGMEYVWTFEDVLPIREEPYVTCIDDYRTAIYFELGGFQNPFSGKSKTVNTWGECGELVDNGFTKFEYDKDKVKRKAQELVRDATTDSAKAVKIYDFVRQKIDWNGERGLYKMNEKSFKKILSRMEGTAWEKNFLLLKLLEHAEIQADPVLIITRDNGRVLRQKPGLIQFNHMIARVRLPERNCFLDAVDKLCPFEVLPREDLGECGLLLDSSRSRIIDFPAPKVISKKHIIIRGNIAADGGLACSSSVCYTGYSNFKVREQIEEEGKEDFAEQFLKPLPVAEMDEASFAHLDSVDQPLEVSFNLSVPQYAQVMGEDIYINPTLFTRMESNPFESESRDFSVDFSYPFTRIEDVELLVPNELEVSQLPEDVNRVMRGAKFSKTFSFEENRLRCYCELTLSKLTFPVEQYEEIRNLYQDIVSADQLQVVLTRKP